MLLVKGLHSFVSWGNSQEGFLFLSVKPSDQLTLTDVRVCKYTALLSHGSCHVYIEFLFDKTGSHQSSVVYARGYEFLQLVIVLPRAPNKGSFGGINRSVGLFFRAVRSQKGS